MHESNYFEFTNLVWTSFNEDLEKKADGFGLADTPSQTKSGKIYMV
jgi:hypothetical protein